jgi:hypothetical protein
MTGKEKAEPGSEKRGVRHVAWGIAVVLMFVLAFGYVVLLLWNWLMPDIFGLRTVTYLQAIGLLLLVRVLFGRMGRRRDHAGYLTGKYGFRSLIGQGSGKDNASNDINDNG